MMAKGYWIGRVDVHDPEAYKKYVAANAVAFEKYGAKFLVNLRDYLDTGLLLYDFMH